MNFCFKLLRCPLAHQLNNLRRTILNVWMFLVARVKIVVKSTHKIFKFWLLSKDAPTKSCKFLLKDWNDWVKASPAIILCTCFTMFDFYPPNYCQTKWFNLYFSTLFNKNYQKVRNYVPIIFSFITPYTWTK
jgi:hypothetical protein